MNLKPADFIAALAPASVGLGLSQVNAALTTVSLVGGILFLAWKWKREAKHPPGK